MAYISTVGLTGQKLEFVRYLDAIIDRVLEHCETSDQPMLWSSLVGEEGEPPQDDNADLDEYDEAPPLKAKPLGRPKKGKSVSAQAPQVATAPVAPTRSDVVLCPHCGTADTEAHRKTKVHASRSSRAIASS